MTTASQEIQNKFIKGLTWKALWAFIVGVITVTAAIVTGFNKIQNDIADIKSDVRSIRYQVKASIDSLKYTQQLRKVETDGKFQRIDDKLDRIQQNTTK